MAVQLGRQQRSFRHDRGPLAGMFASWREAADRAGSLGPDTPEWQAMIDEARHRRFLLDERLEAVSLARRQHRRVRHLHRHP
jgi:hypothetical protein